MITKQCSFCGKWIPVDQTCSCRAAVMKKRNRERHKDYDTHRRDREAASFYQSREWKDKRKAVLNLDQGIDVYMYMTDGIIIPADTVHHIVPLRDDWSKRLDRDNLMSVASSTHGRIEDEYKRLGKHEMERRLTEMLRRYRKETAD